MKRRKTAWLIALISIVTVVMLIGCSTEDDRHIINSENVAITEENQNITHISNNVLKTNQLMVMSEQYDLVYTGNSIIVYKSEKAINEVEIGEATYCGFSNRGNHYFIADNSVIKVTYINNEFEVENIIYGVKRIIDTNFHYNENENSALLVETLDGQFKVWAFDSQWIEL